jgi:hypothetical protein
MQGKKWKEMASQEKGNARGRKVMEQKANEGRTTLDNV